MSGLADGDSAHDAARRHAWDWFAYHAKQRMDVFRFYLIIVTVAIAGILRALESEDHVISAIVSILLMLFTFLFWRLDERNALLVKLGEQYLKNEEDRLYGILHSEEIKIVHMADRERNNYKKWEKYCKSTRQIFFLVFLSIFVSAFVGISYSVSNIIFRSWPG